MNLNATVNHKKLMELTFESAIESYSIFALANPGMFGCQISNQPRMLFSTARLACSIDEPPNRRSQRFSWKSNTCEPRLIVSVRFSTIGGSVTFSGGGW